MFKIGIDIVEISRIEKSVQRDSFLKRVFTENEIAYAENAQSLAGIFAAKEAYFKALGTGITFPLTDIEILHNENGKPYINGKEKCDLSISHDGGIAAATVILWE